jgi:glycosyltransferase involved in cell wall biosynthesis
MKNKPLITIVTVCYNSEHLISETIKSVLNQTYNNIEYIIIDGASTDRTLDIIKEYKPKFNGKMKLISEPDKGIYDAMNKGIESAYGEFIYFLNSGDLFFNNNIVEQVIKEFIKRSNIDIIYGNINIQISPNNQFIKKYKNINFFSLMRHTICHQALFVKTRIFEEIGDFNTKYKFASDYDWIIKCYINKFNFRYIDKIIVNYDFNGISSLNENKNHIINERRKIIREHFNFIGNIIFECFIFLKKIKHSIIN